MLVFFDESFRNSARRPNQVLGALCGIGIPETQLAAVARDVFHLRVKHFGNEWAKNGELKGKDLLKDFVFRLEERGITSKNLKFVDDLITYIVLKKLTIFGCVCFETDLKDFKCSDVRALDKTFRFIFERIDLWMKINHPREMASLVFDDRDFGTNKLNSEAITNFFILSPQGLAMDSIVNTPFFAISEAQNIGLQLADVITAIIAMRFSSEKKIRPYFAALRPAIFRWKTDEGNWRSGLKILRGSQQKRASVSVHYDVLTH